MGVRMVLDCKYKPWEIPTSKPRWFGGPKKEREREREREKERERERVCVCVCCYTQRQFAAESLLVIRTSCNQNYTSNRYHVFLQQVGPRIWKSRNRAGSRFMYATRVAPPLVIISQPQQQQEEQQPPM